VTLFSVLTNSMPVAGFEGDSEQLASGGAGFHAGQIVDKLTGGGDFAFTMGDRGCEPA